MNSLHSLKEILKMKDSENGFSSPPGVPKDCGVYVRNTKSSDATIRDEIQLFGYHDVNQYGFRGVRYGNSRLAHKDISTVGLYSKIIRVKWIDGWQGTFMWTVDEQKQALKHAQKSQKFVLLHEIGYVSGANFINQSSTRLITVQLAPVYMGKVDKSQNEFEFFGIRVSSF